VNRLGERAIGRTIDHRFGPRFEVGDVLIELGDQFLNLRDPFFEPGLIGGERGLAVGEIVRPGFKARCG
jgi:hypothetical protein